jgi:diguanylate cyclase
MDLPCRYGGEEFAVILPATAAANACVVAERIRAAVEASNTVCDGKTLKVTCSIGMSDFLPGDDVAKLIRRADDALYASKKAGRNCGHWNTGAEHIPINAPPPPPEQPKYLPPQEVPSPSGATFIQVLKRRVTESHRFGLPLSVVHLRLEEFDAVTKKHGAAASRQMVEAVSPSMQKSLREMDVLARLDNGEFIVMLPGNTQAEAGLVVKRMRYAASNCVVSLPDGELPVRFCHGIAELKANETAQELLARARQALTAADPSRRPVEA